MVDTVLCFLVRGEPAAEVLLGLKKRGFGAGKYGGIGGKVEPGEEFSLAARRELAEEIGITVEEADLQPAGRITFHFPARPAWSQVMHLFLLRRWRGEPQEGAEVRPEWFPVHGVPYERMWPDARFWLPRVLAGESVVQEFTYAPDCESLVGRGGVCSA
ncbi:MAG: 8-oxo-dGTP diphosphatase [Anaerolineae bacterium]